MPWSSTNCAWAIAPAAWGAGNAPASFNVGTIPAFPNGDYTPVTLTNCAAGFGLVNNAGDCYLRFDGLNDAAIGGDVAEFNTVSTFSIEIWFWQDVLDQIDILFSKYKNNNELVQINTFNNGEMRFYVSNGDNALSHGAFDYSTVVSPGTWHLVSMVFNGPGAANADRLKAYIDGSELTPLTFNNTIPPATSDLSALVTNLGYLVVPIAGRIGWCAVYTDADTTRPATNYLLGRDMGLIGTNVGDSMSLASPTIGGTPIISSAGIHSSIFGGSVING